MVMQNENNEYVNIIMPSRFKHTLPTTDDNDVKTLVLSIAHGSSTDDFET